MKVQYGEEMTNHSGPESCVCVREGAREAVTGETDRPGIEPLNQGHSGCRRCYAKRKAI
jgi:hypothetical protein